MIIYILKRIVLMLFTFAIIFVICFVLIKLLDIIKDTSMYTAQARIIEEIGRAHV